MIGAHSKAMTSLRSLVALALFALAAGGCYPQTAAGQQTFPEPVEVAGPPGGQMDPAFQQQPPPQGPYQGQDPQQYAGIRRSRCRGTIPMRKVDRADRAPMTASRKWMVRTRAWRWATSTTRRSTRPSMARAPGPTSMDTAECGAHATQVGADFTPYETGGSWVDTDNGWAFETDSYGWGWLPFHYGRWGWFDGYWGWQPGYHWGSSWVDWRHGGGYVGWRPQGPIGGWVRARFRSTTRTGSLPPKATSVVTTSVPTSSAIRQKVCA